MGNNRNVICPKCGKKMKKCTCAKGKRGWVIFFSVTILLVVAALFMFLPARKKPSMKTQTDLSEVEKQANVTLDWLIQNHPDPEVRVVMDSLIRNMIIPLSTRTDFPIDEIQFDCTFDTIGVLVYNPYFLIDSSKSDNYKFLVLEHEYKHIKQYFKGKLNKGSKEPKTDQEKYQFAKNIWDAEVDAVSAEIELAIKIKAEDEISEFYHAYKKGGKMFKDFLLQRILENHPYDQMPELHPYLRKIAKNN